MRLKESLIFPQNGLYFDCMRNWSTDENQLKKSPEAHAIWRLEQLINFGLGQEKLTREEVHKYWLKLTIDPGRRAFLNLFLHER